MFKIVSNKTYSKTFSVLNKMKNKNIDQILEKYAQKGLDNLMENTPIDSGLARNSWYYEIETRPSYSKITWYNSDVENDQNVILLLEYGHGTKNGGYVEGINMIDPSLEPVMQGMISEIWKEVINA